MKYICTTCSAQKIHWLCQGTGVSADLLRQPECLAQGEPAPPEHRSRPWPSGRGRWRPAGPSGSPLEKGHQCHQPRSCMGPTCRQRLCKLVCSAQKHVCQPSMSRGRFVGLAGGLEPTLDLMHDPHTLACQALTLQLCSNITGFAQPIPHPGSKYRLLNFVPQEKS